jgi:mono/diheme cytochrome c family protein
MLRFVICVVGFSLGVAAVSAAEDGKDRGEKIFADQKCALCHSIAGKGNVKGPLNEVGSKLQPDEIRAWITDAKGMTARTKAPRKPAMKTYTLPTEEVDTLVEYLSSLKKKK